MFCWGGGKQTPQKIDVLQGGDAAIQVFFYSNFFLTSVPARVNSFSVDVWQCFKNQNHEIFSSCFSEDDFEIEFCSCCWHCCHLHTCKAACHWLIVYIPSSKMIIFYPLLKVAAGRSHFAAVTVEKELYTWAVSPLSVCFSDVVIWYQPYCYSYSNILL